MDKPVPCPRLLSAIEPYYPKGKRGGPPIGLELMLRIYFLQQWYGLSDEGLEDALYDSTAMRVFAGIDLAVEDVPDATTLLKFRRPLVEHYSSKTDPDRRLGSRFDVVRRAATNENQLTASLGHRMQAEASQKAQGPCATLRYKTYLPS